MSTSTTGARLTRKSTKSRPVALPIRMLGGSPISVAVPPILLAITWVIMNGRGSSPRSSQIAIVTGSISRILVTLSSKFVRALNTNTWHTIDLVYDMETLGLFIDGYVRLSWYMHFHTVTSKRFQAMAYLSVRGLTACVTTLREKSPLYNGTWESLSRSKSGLTKRGVPLNGS